MRTTKVQFRLNSTFSNKENNCADSKSALEICNRDENSSSVTIQFAVFPVTMCSSIFVVSNLWV